MEVFSARPIDPGHVRQAAGFGVGQELCLGFDVTVHGRVLVLGEGEAFAVVGPRLLCLRQASWQARGLNRERVAMAGVHEGPFGVPADGEAMIRKGIAGVIREVVVAHGEAVHQQIEVGQFGCRVGLATCAARRRRLALHPVSMVMRRIWDHNIRREGQRGIAADSRDVARDIVGGVILHKEDHHLGNGRRRRCGRARALRSLLGHVPPPCP